MSTRRRTDRLFVRTLGSREREALGLIEQRPGLTVAELAEALGVGMTRAWQIVGRLETGRVRPRALRTNLGTNLPLGTREPRW